MTNATFYIAAAVAILSTFKVITQFNAVRALLYLIVSLLSVAIIFYLLGAPFAAALEVITYAGAIMVLFVFMIMMLNLGPLSVKQERQWLNPKMWIGPSILATILLGELIYILISTRFMHGGQPLTVISPEQVGTALFGPYALGVELASMLLLAGLVGAYHLGYRTLALTDKKTSKRHIQPAALAPAISIIPPQAKKREAGAS
jgi:NADH-quinone oxidoreductase subunit J